MGLLAMLAATTGSQLLGHYLNQRSARGASKENRQQIARDRLNSSLSSRGGRGGGGGGSQGGGSALGQTLTSDTMQKMLAQLGQLGPASSPGRTPNQYYSSPGFPSPYGPSSGQAPSWFFK